MGNKHEAAPLDKEIMAFDCCWEEQSFFNGVVANISTTLQNMSYAQQQLAKTNFTPCLFREREIQNMRLGRQGVGETGRH